MLTRCILRLSLLTFQIQHSGITRRCDGDKESEGEFMENRAVPVCGEHHIKKEWRATTFEYKDEAITVRVPNVYAWVCPVTGEASYTPETVDELIVAVNELVELAKRAQKRRPALTEYTLYVGVPASDVVYSSASVNVAENSESYSVQSTAYPCDDKD